MERLAIRKNVLLGFVVFCWPLALICLITEKDQPKEVRKFFIMGVVFAAFFAACGIIPFVGWACEIPVTVFYILALVQTFKGNFSYNVPLIGNIVDSFNNK